MVLIDTQYGPFEEINHLNKNFIPGINKMRLTMDTVSSVETYEKAYLPIIKQFTHLFPRLKKHSCCYIKMNEVSHKKHPVKPIVKMDNYIIDIIHIMEHVIIDMQCSLSGMNICSGITCNYKEPSNRFDIFVECIDQKIGFSAAQTAIEMVQRVLASNRLTNKSFDFLPINEFISNPMKENKVTGTNESGNLFLLDLNKYLINRMMNFMVTIN